jgi:hypothetical protein
MSFCGFFRWHGFSPLTFDSWSRRNLTCLGDLPRRNSVETGATAKTDEGGSTLNGSP